MLLKSWFSLHTTTNAASRKIIGGLILIIAFGVQCATCSAAPLPSNIQSLISQADDLYVEGAHIVDQAPRTQRAADAIAASPVRKSFGAEERAFQDAVSALPSTGELESMRSQATVRLGQFGNIVFTAVNDVMGTCNIGAARVNLRIAKQILGELHRIAAGHGHNDWNPPSLDDDQPEHARCV